MTEKIPRWFIRLYLKVKGWQDVLEFSTDDEDLDYPGLPEHPIRWLWDRIQRKVEVRIGVVHSWDRQIGRDTGDMEHWHRWIYYAWNFEKEGWEIYDVTYSDGRFDVQPPRWSPRVGSIVARSDLRKKKK